MSCFTCAHAALRSSSDDKRDKALKAMAKMKFINCTRSPFGADFHAFEHRCDRFEQAKPEVVSLRTNWAAKAFPTP